MKKFTNESLFLIASVILLIAAGSIGLEIPALLETKTPSRQTLPSVVNKSLSNIERALKIESKSDFFTYSATFESPYRKKGETVQVDKNIKQLPGPIRPRLILKGVLLNANALAILEDEQGKTYIRGAGDTILDQQTIIAIKANRVIMRDRQGSYELTVEEH
ncbi:MAG: hypothetical protein GX640_02495 [Fibrobacter sp.]|nr:hypothetical protein [Fibrobacter sp.]